MEMKRSFFIECVADAQLLRSSPNEAEERKERWALRLRGGASGLLWASRIDLGRHAGRTGLEDVLPDALGSLSIEHDELLTEHDDDRVLVVATARVLGLDRILELLHALLRGAEIGVDLSELVVDAGDTDDVPLLPRFIQHRLNPTAQILTTLNDAASFDALFLRREVCATTGIDRPLGILGRLVPLTVIRLRHGEAVAGRRNNPSQDERMEDAFKSRHRGSPPKVAASISAIPSKSTTMA